MRRFIEDDDDFEGMNECRLRDDEVCDFCEDMRMRWGCTLQGYDRFFWEAIEDIEDTVIMCKYV